MKVKTHLELQCPDCKYPMVNLANPDVDTPFEIVAFRCDTPGCKHKGKKFKPNPWPMVELEEMKDGD